MDIRPPDRARHPGRGAVPAIISSGRIPTRAAIYALVAIPIDARFFRRSPTATCD